MWSWVRAPREVQPFAGVAAAPLAQWIARWTSNPKVAGSSPAGGSVCLTILVCDRMAEWSKAPDSSSGLFGGAGSNPAPVKAFWHALLQACNRGLTVRILAFQASGPGSTPGGCTLFGDPATNSPTRIRTAVAGFRVLSANHYTMGDCTPASCRSSVV